MRPPVSNYGTLEFGSFQSVYNIGYDYAKQFLKDAEENGTLDDVPTSGNRRTKQKRSPLAANIRRDRRNSL